MIASSSPFSVCGIPEIFLSGQCVPSGVYRSLFSGREIALPEDTCLPSQPDGSSALYVRLTRDTHQYLKSSLRHSPLAKESQAA